MHFYHLAVPLVYLTLANPFLRVVNPLWWMLYSLARLPFTKGLKNFSLQETTKDQCVLVYSSDKVSMNKIFNKIRLLKDKKDYEFIDIKEFNEITDHSSPVLVVSTDLSDIAKVNKLDVDYLIISCKKHIVYQDSVFQEFFKYTGIDKQKFYDIYNNHDSLVLDMKNGEIFSFT